MGFPTVKSNPYTKGLRPPKPRFALWSNGFWRRICDVAKFYWPTPPQRVHPLVLEMICEMNLRLYGKA